MPWQELLVPAWHPHWLVPGGAPTCFPCCTASLSLEVVAEDDDDGRNTFLTTANQPPLPAACFFPMVPCPRDHPGRLATSWYW